MIEFQQRAKRKDIKGLASRRVWDAKGHAGLRIEEIQSMLEDCTRYLVIRDDQVVSRHRKKSAAFRAAGGAK